MLIMKSVDLPSLGNNASTIILCSCFRWR